MYTYICKYMYVYTNMYGYNIRLKYNVSSPSKPQNLCNAPYR